jgi:uncharacterized protein (TIGR04255 family)
MPHYNKAPITEALIDIRIDPLPEQQFANLQRSKKYLPDYPHEEKRNLGHATVQFGPSVQAVAQEKPWGLLFRNAGNTQVVQFRLDGFTFSRLEPYETWEQLRDEARRLWDIYREVVGAKQLASVGVRYINVLSLPTVPVEPEDYLKTYPQVSLELPADLRDFGPFFLSLAMNQPDLKGVLTINEGNAPPKGQNTVSIVLDLSLSVPNPPAKNEDELWLFFEKLRDRKNLYFEACITDKTRELIA